MANLVLEEAKGPRVRRVVWIKPPDDVGGCRWSENAVLAYQSSPSIEKASMNEKPVLFEHCEKMYLAMDDQATPYHDSTVGSITVYRGFTTALMREIGLPQHFHGHVMSKLKQMGCVEQIERGAYHSPSLFKLVRAPTLEGFKEAVKTNDRRPSAKEMEQRIADLIRLLGGVDVPKVLAELQERIEALETQAHWHGPDGRPADV